MSSMFGWVDRMTEAEDAAAVFTPCLDFASVALLSFFVFYRANRSLGKVA